jgi:hypothetical protein
MQTTKDGFVTANDTAFFGRVAECLNEISPGLNAYVEHTGGGIFCINIEGPRPGHFMYWGTEGDTWVADVNDADGEYVDSIETALPSKSRNTDEVAAAIVATINRYGN